MYLSDMHTHSIASGHGTACTISDMARAAARKGLKLLGITDHGPKTPGAGTPSYFRSLAFSPRKRYGIELLYGVELNILDTEGHTDLEDSLLQNLDYAIASMHWNNCPPQSLSDNTRAFLNVMKNPCVKILGHTDNPDYPVDYDAIAACAAASDVFLELNEASLLPGSPRRDCRASCLALLHACKKYQTPILLSSDSHGAAQIGDFTMAAVLLRETCFPEALIYNNQLPKLKAILSGRSCF